MNPKVEILATIKRFNNIPLDEDALAGIARVDFNRAIEAISWLLEQKYVYKHKNKFFITVPGREYLAAKGFESLKKGNFQKWKDEALTGMIELKSPRCNNVITDKSTMDKAVLNTKNAECLRRDAGKVFDQIDDIVSLKKKLCRQFDLTIDQCEALWKEGRFRLCDEGETHIGIFDRHDRKRWQHICRECRKKKRRYDGQKRRIERDRTDTR